MHIPDGFLSTPVWATMDAISIPSIALLSRRAQRGLTDFSQLDTSRIPLMGVMGAFIFAAQMINFPVGNGTSSHLVGAALLSFTLGPAVASMVMTAILAIQALVFQDGGLLALGANVFNMAIAGVFAGYLPYVLLRGKKSGIFFGATLSLLVSAMLALGELAQSGVRMPRPDADRFFSFVHSFGRSGRRDHRDDRRRAAQNRTRASAPSRILEPAQPYSRRSLRVAGGAGGFHRFPPARWHRKGGAKDRRGGPCRFPGKFTAGRLSFRLPHIVIAPDPGVDAGAGGPGGPGGRLSRLCRAEPSSARLAIRYEPEGRLTLDSARIETRYLQRRHPAAKILLGSRVPGLSRHRVATGSAPAERRSGATRCSASSPRICRPLACSVSAAAVLPFAFVFAAFTALAGDTNRATLLVIRGYLSALAVVLLAATAPVSDLLAGLEFLRAPRFLLSVMQFLYRYLMVLSAEAAAMRDASLSRAGSFRALQLRQASAAAAILFARAWSRAQAVHNAMLSRGFDGTLPRLRRPRFTAADGWFAGAGAALVIAVRLAA